MNKDRLDELRRNAWENQKWPQNYIFKFIVPNEGGKVKEVVAFLPNEARLSYKHTKNLRHVSVTAISFMESLEKVKEITEKATSISGVIAL